MHDQLLARLLDCHRPLPPDPERAWARQGPIGWPDVRLGPVRDWVRERLLAAAEVLAVVDDPALLDWPVSPDFGSVVGAEDPLTDDEGDAKAA